MLDVYSSVCMMDGYCCLQSSTCFLMAASTPGTSSSSPSELSELDMLNKVTIQSEVICLIGMDDLVALQVVEYRTFL